MAIACLFVVGCGGNGAARDTANSGGNSTAVHTAKRNSQSGQGAKGFLEPKNPNNRYVKFGEEASLPVRQTASRVLGENLRAREAGDFAAQCATLSAAGVEEIGGTSKQGRAQSLCAAGLKKLAEPLKGSAKARADTFGGELGAFRVKDGKGYAFYHGKDGNDWMMPMYEEQGVWKVGSIIAIAVG